MPPFRQYPLIVPLRRGFQKQGSVIATAILFRKKIIYFTQLLISCQTDGYEIACENLRDLSLVKFTENAL